MKNKREDANTGYISFPGLQSVLADRSYRFDGRQNDPAVIARLATGFNEIGEASQTSVDLRGTRELMSMAGGPLAIAVGGELRREEIDIISDPKIVAGDVVGRGTSAAHGSRDISAIYAEVSIPFVKNLETQLALRTDTQRLRQRNAQGGRGTCRCRLASRCGAPTRRGLPRPLTPDLESSVRAFNNNVRDPLRCPVFDATIRDCATTFASYIRANPELKPEKSDNYTAGFVVQPTRDFAAAVDYWYIKRKDQIDRFSAAYLLAREAQFPQAIVRDPNPATWLPGVPNSGPIFAVLRQFFNLASTEVDGSTWHQLDGSPRRHGNRHAARRLVPAHYSTGGAAD